MEDLNSIEKIRMSKYISKEFKYQFYICHHFFMARVCKILFIFFMIVCSDCSMYLCTVFCKIDYDLVWFLCFNGSSTFVGYLIPKPSL